MNRQFALLGVPLVALVAGGILQFKRPLPPIQVQVSPGNLTLPGALSVSFPNAGQGAVGEASLGVVSQTPNEQPVAIASLTKMMTAYLYLQAKPLQVGQDGPVTTISAADVIQYQNDKASGDSVVRVQAGEKLTERQILEGLLLPSGDNMATLIAQQVAGSEANFVTKMNQAAHALGMTQTTYSDTSGVSPATVSTAHDQILIAQAAMRDPEFRRIVRMPQADLPVAGRVFNVDSMVGKHGISGIKTGSTLEAGSCFVGAYPVTVGGQPRIIIAAILGQQSLRVALATAVDLLHQVAPQFTESPVAAPADGFARIQTAWGQQSALALAAPLSVFGYPGMAIGLTGGLVGAKLPIAAGARVATLKVTTGAYSQTLGLAARQAIRPPGILWRLYR